MISFAANFLDWGRSWTELQLPIIIKIWIYDLEESIRKDISSEVAIYAALLASWKAHRGMIYDVFLLTCDGNR